MDTLQFLQAILPAEGVHYLGLMRTGITGVAHKPYTSLEDMAKAMTFFDKNPTVTVYHACASYKEPYVTVTNEEGVEKKKYRIASNALAAKAFWIDVDIGEEKAEKNKGYATKNAGWAAVGNFCKTVGLPLPLVVDSGGGLHCYWPLTAPVPAADWRGHAARFKAILEHFNVYADPTRTADFASVLRPVGSTNKKYDPPRTIKVVREAGPFDLKDILDTFDAVMEANGIEADMLVGVPPVAPGLNSDLTAHGYPDIPCDANKMADACKQVALVRDTQGDVEYEHWRGVVGTLTFCKDGRATAVEWNAQRAATGHGQTDVLQKYDTWNSPPTTCEFLAKANPTGCEGCAHKGKVKTPLMLARVEPEPAKAETIHTTMDGVNVVVEAPEELPGFKWVPNVGKDSGTMMRYKPNKDGMLEAHPFTYHRFYPIARICQPDGKFMLRMRVHLPKRGVREFEIPTALVAVGGKELAKAMGEYEVTPVNEVCMPHMTAYMKAQLERLMATTHEVTTMTAFGWRDDKKAFLYGSKLYMDDGTVRPVVLGGLAATLQKAFPPPAGRVDDWVEGVNFIYNRKGMECMQYAVCSGFGSLLSVFGESQYKGVPVALTSADSGKGKTTACRAALFAFGAADVLQINGKDGMTVNSRGALMGALNNIPILVDEITHINAEELSALLYAASNGHDKIRMTSKGGSVTLAESYTWSMSMFMTANKHLTAALGAAQANSKAEANRIIELRIDSYDIPKLNPMEIDHANRLIESGSGTAGELFIRWIVTHVKEIQKRVLELNGRLLKRAPVLQNNEYRYYRQHAVMTLVAAGIMHEIGLQQFDVSALEDFTVSLVDKLCKDAVEHNETSSEDALNQMINSMSGVIIATNEYRKNSDARGLEEVRIHGEPVGRYIRGEVLNGKEPLAGRLYLSKKAVKQWCLANRIDVDTLINGARAHGYLIEELDDRFLLGRGTEVVTSQVRCFIFDLAKMQGEGAASSTLKLISGDKEA